MDRELLDLLHTLALLVLPLLCGAVGRWLLGAYQAQPGRRRQFIDAVVVSAVTAAEQLYRTAVIQDRKDWALGEAARQLAEHGIAVTPRDLSTAIEAYVFQAKNWWAERPKE